MIEAVASLSTDVSVPAILFLSPLPDYSQLFMKKRAGELGVTVIGNSNWNSFVG
jgi:hypothetical protein